MRLSITYTLWISLFAGSAVNAQPFDYFQVQQEVRNVGVATDAKMGPISDPNADPQIGQPLKSGSVQNTGFGPLVTSSTSSTAAWNGWTANADGTSSGTTSIRETLGEHVSMIAPDLHADITPPNPPGAVPFPCNSWAQGSATSETACDCTVKTEEGPGPHTLQGRIDFDAMGTAKGEFTFLTLRAVCAGSTLTAKYNDFADKWTITGSIKVGAGAPVVINETITGLSLSYSKLFFQPFPNGAAYINTYATYGGQVRAVDGVSTPVLTDDLEGTYRSRIMAGL